MKNIVKIILLAAVSAALAVIVEQAVAAAAYFFWQTEPVLDSYSYFTWFLVFAAAIEEISKYWAVYFVIRKRFGLEKVKFVLASFLLGASWGIFEIALVLFASRKTLVEFQTGDPEVIFSFASIIALQALTAFLMGTFISANTFSGQLKHLKNLFFPVFIHLLFNFLIIQRGTFTNSLIIIALTLFYLIGISILFFSRKKLA
jgi:hypothetical protein